MLEMAIPDFVGTHGLAKLFKDFGRLGAVLTPQAVLRDLCVLRGENVSCPAL